MAEEEQKMPSAFPRNTGPTSNSENETTTQAKFEAVRQIGSAGKQPLDLPTPPDGSNMGDFDNTWTKDCRYSTNRRHHKVNAIAAEMQLNPAVEPVYEDMRPRANSEPEQLEGL